EYLARILEAVSELPDRAVLVVPEQKPVRRHAARPPVVPAIGLKLAPLPGLGIEQPCPLIEAHRKKLVPLEREGEHAAPFRMRNPLLDPRVRNPLRNLPADIDDAVFTHP